jgi:AcrR family transcriptional regulator
MKTKKAYLKREKILAAAAKTFKEKGYAETTLTDVALEAGTFAGSLYYYFSSKESLVEEVLNVGTNRIADLVIGEVKRLPRTVSKIDRLEVALRTHMKLSMERDDFGLAYWRIVDQVPQEIRERHAAMPRAYGRFWKKLIEDAQEAGEVRSDLDARIVGLFILGSTLYALDWFHESGPYDVKHLSDILFAMTIKGIGTKSERSQNSSKEDHAIDHTSAAVIRVDPARRRVDGKQRSR